jgi:carbon starvation protein
MNALTLIFASLCIFAIGYRFYGIFLSRKLLHINSGRITPAHKYYDGRDYVPTNKNVLFGHHFAAIAAAGPLAGPVLAAQFGFLPGALWILIGCVLGGAVHDLVVLFASLRHKGQSLATIATKELNGTIGMVAAFAILLGKNAVGVASLQALFTWNAKPLSIAIAVYGFFASVLPVWFLLVPRDYLSSYLKIGTIVSLALGIIFIHPVIQMPAFTSFIKGGGPIIGGPVIPFIFIIIACGAISGFHAIIGTGTTPKMLNNENDLLFVGYGAMLVEGFVAIMALIAAVTLAPGDYFAINTPKSAYDAFLAANPGLAVKDLAFFSEKIGIDLAGRTGGAVSLAVGMANIFSKIPSMDKLMAYWYNFAVMFEAVFILTAIDAGTRVGRFFLQELLGRAIPYFKDQKRKEGVLIAGLLFTLSWGYLVYTGDIGSIWPLFGISNQLLASCALIVCTTMFIRMNRGKLALLTAIPGIFMAAVTLWAGYIQVFGMQLSSGIFLKGYFHKNQFLLGILAIIVMIFMIIVFVSSFKKWYELAKIKSLTTDKYGELVKAVVEE